jgi:hypothetical protein
MALEVYRGLLYNFVKEEIVLVAAALAAAVIAIS